MRPADIGRLRAAADILLETRESTDLAVAAARGVHALLGERDEAAQEAAKVVADLARERAASDDARSTADGLQRELVQALTDLRGAAEREGDHARAALILDRINDLVPWSAP